MRLIDCDMSHAHAILAIFNDAIANSTALYDYQPRTMETMTAWFDAKRKGHDPVVGLLGDDGALAGFGSYGPFRNFPAYKYTVEHSLYVAPGWRGKGFGKTLLEELIRRVRAQDYHVMVGAIDSANGASIALHRAFGFQRMGTLPQVGFKFGRWLDLCLYQLVLDTPAHPADG